MEKTKMNKFVVILIVFMILFSNIGSTVAIATENQFFEEINKGFFQKEEISFEGYFEDENGKKTNKITEDVNHKIKLILDVVPEIEGYLKSGLIKIVAKDGSDINFKITSVNGIEEEKSEQDRLEDKLTSIGEEDNSENGMLNEEAFLKAMQEEENKPKEDATLKTSEELKNELLNALNTESNESENPKVEFEEILVNEEEFIEEKTQEMKEDTNQKLALDVVKTADDEISLSNLVENTRIIMELEYNQKDSIKIDDLYKAFEVQLSGTFINENLDEVKVAKKDSLELGWSYSKDIVIKDEYTKFSQYELQEFKGTIVENKISVQRNIEEQNYLPIKSTLLEIDVPVLNDKKPVEVDLIANKLMATRGEDVGEVVFSADNWKYDEINGKILVLINNDNLINTKGADEFTIVYRYEDCIREEMQTLPKILKVKVEEFSGLDNNYLVKEFNENQEIKVEVGDLISYDINSVDETINKGKIYANYNSKDGLYETEFKTQVNANILTSGVLEELKIESVNEYYNTYTNSKVIAEGILNKKIRFNYQEIKELLSKGGEIVITNENSEILYKLDNELIKSQDDCEIDLKDSKGIYVYARNIKENGDLNFEITKAIKKCNLDKVVFKDVKNIESSVKAEVKYLNVDERFNLQEVSAKTYLMESTTTATLKIDNKELKTLEPNEDVELRIQLNNAKENSDLYINPVFELVFPKYVKKVSVESINLLYEEGLKVKDFKTYTEGENIKMRIELEGIQERFSQSAITNGTNIIVNVNIDVDTYTPSKEDQIKLYYINEGVTNYQSQTNWKISKDIPDGILKITNGFDAEIIKYQAPEGMVPINGMINYDGNLGELRTVKQGKVTKEIPMNSSARVVTMELLALNNTENDISDIKMLGRIPSNGIKDVVTNEDIGSNIDTILRDKIQADVKNPNMVDIYYSSNINADNNLENGENGWNKEITDFSKVKSYLIVVNGNLKPGQVLRYTYDFEIPENLPYDACVQGNFGVYYKNNKEVAVVDEVDTADLVALTTEKGPKLEGVLTVDIGNNSDIGECRFMNYTLVVKNTGSKQAKDVEVKIDQPTNGRFYEYYYKDIGYGNNNYVESSKNQLVFQYDEIKPGEEKAVTYMVKTKKMLNEDNNEVKSKAKITCKNLNMEIESNEVINKMIKKNFDLEINTNTFGHMDVNQSKQIKVSAYNISGEDLKDVKVSCRLPEEFIYEDIEVVTENEGDFDEDSLLYDEDTNIVSLKLKELKKDLFVDIKIKVLAVKTSKNNTETVVNFKVEDETEKTTPCYLRVNGAFLTVSQTTNVQEVKEGDNVQFVFYINNEGNKPSETIKIKDEFSEYLDIKKISYSGASSGNLYAKNSVLDSYMNNITNGGSVIMVVDAAVKDIPNDIQKLEIKNKATFITGEFSSIDSNEVNIVVKQNEDRPPLVDETEDNESEGNNPNGNGGDTNPNTPDNPDNPNNPDKPVNPNNPDNGENSDNNNVNPNDNNGGNKPNENKPNENKPNENKPEDNQKPKPNNPDQEDNKDTSEKDENGSNNKPNKEDNKVYSLSGKVWLDENRDGKNDPNEKRVSSIKVQITKDNQTVQAATTNSNGEYKFDNLKKGEYVIIFTYDSEKFATTAYKKVNISDSMNSDAVETSEGSAVTNKIKIENKNIENIDLGLQNKDRFDLGIEKYLTNAVVTTRKGEKKYEFDNEKISKVEIRAKEIKGAKVKLTYRIVVENIGAIEGNALQILDRLPKDMKFDESQNKGWYLGKDGFLYNETLKDKVLRNGEKAELTLVLEKEMTPNNVGTISNKGIIGETKNTTLVKENEENNVSSQEILVLISTGGSIYAIFGSIIVVLLAGFVYMNRNKLNLGGFNLYKNSSKTNNKIKKIYK